MQHRFEGRIECRVGWLVRGWAVDLARPRQPVALLAVSDDQILARLVPSLSRLDLEVGRPAGVRCGFVYRIPAELLDGRRHRLHLVFEATGAELDGSPLIVRSLEEGRHLPFRTSDLTGARVLVLAPHPDDETIGCGGGLALHRRRGDPVKQVVLTDGGRAERRGPQPQEAYPQRREAEARAAASVLGVSDLEFWGFPDRGLQAHTAEAGERLRRLLGAYRPTLIYCTSPMDGHPDHRAAAELLWTAVQELHLPAALAFCESSQPLHVNVLVNISDVVELKRRALEAYQSQQQHPYLDAALALARYRALPVSASCTHAEGYCLFEAGEVWRAPVHSVALAQVRSLLPAVSSLQVPLVSLIVRSCNRQCLLREALGSILVQTYPRLEVVLVDDGNEDLSDLIQEFTLQGLSLVYVAPQDPRGRTAAANRGLGRASGKYVGFLDDDDLLYPEHVEKLTSFLELTGQPVAYSECDWSRYGVEAGAPQLLERGAPPFDMRFDPRRLRTANFLPILCVLFTRALAQKVGPFDETFEACEDWDYWIRLSEHAHFQHLPGATAEVRVFSEHSFDRLRWQLAIYRKHGFPRGHLHKAWMHWKGLRWQLRVLRQENSRLRRKTQVLTRRLEQAPGLWSRKEKPRPWPNPLLWLRRQVRGGLRWIRRGPAGP